MATSDIVAENPPPTNIPKHGKTCLVSVVDTTCILTVHGGTLVEPVIPGHELMNFPTVAFLITNISQGKQILFDLGCQRDFWNLPRPIAEVIETKVPGIKVDKNLVEVLVEGGIDVTEIDAAIISHHHYDHIGDPSTFPKSMDLLVGPGFSNEFLPGYPTREFSPVFERAFKGRNVREITFSDHLVIAGFRAVDYFADGSLYILDTPGHAIGHLSALVRTTEDTFIFLGGDICHFGGTFRPSKYVPLPRSLSPDEVGCSNERTEHFDSSIFTLCHPDPPNARISPYYAPCCGADSWYVSPPLARQSIDKLKALDANERVLVMIAHDPSIMNVVTFFPHGTANNWLDGGWKQRLRWRFLDELPVKGKPIKYLVDGTYINGTRVRTLSGKNVE
jgi:glyoxylase-like metal-dependent hydrolase (beta-lactamase superfamily II)